MQWKGVLLFLLSSIEAYNIYLAAIRNMGGDIETETGRQRQRHGERDQMDDGITMVIGDVGRQNREEKGRQ